MRKLMISVTLASVMSACSVAANSDLNAVHQSIETRFSHINHIAASDFSELPRQSYVLFDVRELAEYNVSHMEGAIRVDPELSGEDFMAKFGDQIAGKDVILYCSVGERSSRLASRIYSASEQSFTVHNLEKGIFGWHNDQRSLTRGETATDKVHPYDEKWGRLVDRQEQVRYKAD